MQEHNCAELLRLQENISSIGKETTSEKPNIAKIALLIGKSEIIVRNLLWDLEQED